MTQFAAIGLLLSASAALAQNTTTIPTVTLQQFKAMQGINTHMEYTDGKYANYQQVLRDLQYLGITHIRNGVNVPGYSASAGVPDLEYLLDNGIFADIIISTQAPTCGNPPAAAASCAVPLNTAAIDGLVSHKAGSVISVEGLNETNNQAGVTEPEAESIQAAQYSATQSDSGLKGVSVLDHTGLVQHPASSPGLFNQANIHPYPKQGTEPEATFAQNLVSQYTGQPASKAITEFGYSGVADGVDGVDEYAQGDMLLTGLFDAAADGYASVYFYELLDAYPNASYYGLFHYDDGGPKLAATYLHYLNQTLPNDAPSASVKLSSTTVDLPSTARQLGITASNGDQYVCTWNEHTSWNLQTQQYTMDQLELFHEYLPGYWSSVTEFAPQIASEYEFVVPKWSVINGQQTYGGLYTNSPVCLHFHK